MNLKANVQTFLWKSSRHISYIICLNSLTFNSISSTNKGTPGSLAQHGVFNEFLFFWAVYTGEKTSVFCLASEEYNTSYLKGHEVYLPELGKHISCNKRLMTYSYKWCTSKMFNAVQMFFLIWRDVEPVAQHLFKWGKTFLQDYLVILKLMVQNYQLTLNGYLLVNDISNVNHS